MPLQPDMVGVVVSDLSRAVKFYCPPGLPFADVAPDEDLAELTTPNGNRISLNKASMIAAILGHWEPPPAHAGQRMEMALKAGSPDGSGCGGGGGSEGGPRRGEGPLGRFLGPTLRGGGRPGWHAHQHLCGPLAVARAATITAISRLPVM